MWGTVGPGLTPGSRLGRQTGSGTDGSGSRTEKRFQMVPPIFALLRHLGPHVGYRLVPADPRITSGPADRFWNQRFRFLLRKTVPNGSAHFCFITAKLRHLGPHVGYRWVRADPRITPGPAEPFGTERFRFQNRKTVPPILGPF